jgi:hypothetical protein
MKTVKEAARAHFDTITLPGINAGGDVFVNVKKEAYKDVFLEAFEAGAKYAQRWISVKDELPEGAGYVLIKNRYGDISTALYNKARFAIDFEDISDKNVTHWRHIELK